MPITFSGFPVYDKTLAGSELARFQARYGYPPWPKDWERINSFRNPLGREPGRGSFLVLYDDLRRLDLNAYHTVAFDDGSGPVTLYYLVITREPQALIPAAADTLDVLSSVYVVEVADLRWMCHNPNFHVPLNKQYNVRAPGYDGAYYERTCSDNIEIPWTWEGMVQDIWSQMSGFLWADYTLPFAPHGTPEGWRFVGASAWEALCQVLDRLGCAVRCNPTLTADQFDIVQIGEADAIQDALVTRAESEGRLVHDEQYRAVQLGKLPYGCRVYFHYLQEHAGTEPTTTKDADQPTTDPAYWEDVAGPYTATTASQLYHPLWDDLPARIDVDGNLLNLAELQARAQERTDDFFRRRHATGGGRLRKVFVGILAWSDVVTDGGVVVPSSMLREVTWRQDERGGLVTELLRYPLATAGEGDEAAPAGPVTGGPNSEGSAALQPPDLAPEEPSYPPLVQVVDVIATSPTTGVLYDARVKSAIPSSWATATTYRDRERVWAVPLADGHTIGRLIGYAEGRPVYGVPAVGGAVPDQSGSGTGTEPTGLCALAALRTTDCVKATDGNQTLYLEWDGECWSTPLGSGAGSEYEYPGGAGRLQLCYSTGRLRLRLDGADLLDCGNGCFTGGPLTGHAPDEAGAASAASACAYFSGGTPSSWAVMIAGMPAPSCDDYNGTWTLTQTADECVYEVTLPNDNVIKLTVTSGTLTLTIGKSDGSATYATYTNSLWDGSGSAAATLTLDSASGLACDADWPLTLELTPSLPAEGSGSDPVPCTGTTFTICLSCSACPISGWDGEGWYCVGTGGSCVDPEPIYLTEEDFDDPDLLICSGPFASFVLANAACGVAGGGGSQTVGCCPDPIPETLYASFYDGTGVLDPNYVGENGRTVVLAYTEIAGPPLERFWYWEGPMLSNGNTGSLRLECDEDVDPDLWTLRFINDHGSLSTSTCDFFLSQESGVCDPFEQVWFASNTCFFGSFRVRISATPP